MSIIKTNWSKGLAAAVVGLSMLSLTSCNDSFIFDYEGDCSLHYKLNFVYDMNLKWANAFSNEVKSVRVYAFNEDGELVKVFMNNDATLISQPGFDIDLDLPPGTYKLVGWCGIDNTNVTTQSFSAPWTDNLKIEDLDCKLNWKSNAQYPAYSDDHLQFTFWGELGDVLIEAENEVGGTIYYTMPLIKDTNHLRVQLVQLSGEPTEVNDFTYTVEAVDGEMNYKNELIGNTEITYLPWNKENAMAGMDNDGTGDTKALIYAQTAIVDLDMSRFTVGETETMMLTIRDNETGEISARVPIIQYALLSKKYYEEAYGHKMSDQEFLDRQDEYNMTFFLDEGMKWSYVTIDILSWRLVVHNYDLN